MKKAYIVVTHSFSPIEGQKTHQKNWAKTGRWNSDEKVEVVKNLKDRHYNRQSCEDDHYSRGECQAYQNGF